MSYLAANIFDDSFTTIDITQRMQRGVSIEVVRIKMIKVGTIADGTLTLEIYEGVWPTFTGRNFSLLPAASHTSFKANLNGLVFVHF